MVAELHELGPTEANLSDTDSLSTEEQQFSLEAAMMLGRYLHARSFDAEVEAAQAKLEQAELDGADELTLRRLRHNLHYFQDTRLKLHEVRHASHPEDEQVCLDI